MINISKWRFIATIATIATIYLHTKSVNTNNKSEKHLRKYDEILKCFKFPSSFLHPQFLCKFTLFSIFVCHVIWCITSHPYNGNKFSFNQNDNNIGGITTTTTKKTNHTTSFNSGQNKTFSCDVLIVLQMHHALNTFYVQIGRYSSSISGFVNDDYHDYWHQRSFYTFAQNSWNRFFNCFFFCNDDIYMKTRETKIVNYYYN